MLKMYFVTTVQVNENDILDTRCVGYFENYEDAAIIVKKNKCDIYEGIYNYAVIEEVPSGLYQFAFNPQWFLFSKEKAAYEEIEKPEFAQNTIGFSIG
jgi:hypothetical protein